MWLRERRIGAAGVAYRGDGAVMSIVGDTYEERHNERELVRASMSPYVNMHLPLERRRNARMPEILALP
jgi:hypothetical protein